MNNKINLVLGTMTFGEQLFENDVVDIVKFYLESGYDEIDTAYVYNNGKSEELLGLCFNQLQPKSVKIPALQAVWMEMRYACNSRSLLKEWGLIK